MTDHLQDRAELSRAEEEALAAVLRAPELTEAEWARLRARVTSAAAEPLAGRRLTFSPRRRTRRWLYPLLPLAAAALLLVVLGTPDPPAAELTAAEQALLAESQTEFDRLVSGAADAESLLLMAVSDE